MYYYKNLKPFYYATYVRLVNNKTPSLKCEGTKLTKYRDKSTNMYVGILDADEATFAGGKYDSPHLNYYLINEYNSFKKSTWLLSPIYYKDYEDNYYDLVLQQNSSGMLGMGALVTTLMGVRPSIILNNNVNIINGDGTQINPYII